MNRQISVIAPCYNEESNLRELVSRLQKVFSLKQINGEIILVDDGSSDKTALVMRELEAENIICVYKKKNEGMVAAWRSGLSVCRGEFTCLIDADLQNLPEDVYRLYREINYCKSDIVQGFRSAVGRIKGPRYHLSVGLNFLLNFFFSMNLKDNKSGFFICRKEVMEEILRYRFNYKYFQTFVMVAAKSRGFSIREIETIFENRYAGKSFISNFPIKVILQCLFEILLAIYEFRISSHRQTILGEYLSQKNILVKDRLKGWRKWWFNIYCNTMPLHAWTITRNVKKYYEELKKSQWLSPLEIKEIQELKLRRLIQQAYYHVAYYRELFDAHGLKPTDIKSIEDLQKIPFLEKKTIREHLYFDMLSDNHNKKDILKISTSGSTGEPFICYADRFQLEMRWAATMRGMEMAGYRFGDRVARLWHQTIGMSWKQIARERIDAWMTRRMFIPAYEMGDDNIEKSIKKLCSYKPTLIDGYAESFNMLASYIKSKGISGFQPKSIISSAQVLPEQSRKIIEDEFGCNVFDKYGSREFSGIAWQAIGGDGHLIVAENYIVEVIKDGRPALPGETGEVVITDLNNYCMPLIRYRIGDLAIASDNTKPSPCGRGLPRIGSIEGRVQAIIIGSNNKYVPGTFFAHLFKDYDYAIKQYQVIQEQLGEIELKLIKGGRFTEEALEKILAQLRKFLGSDMSIQVKFVDHIPLVRTGKHQGAISKLSYDFQNNKNLQHEGTLGGKMRLETV